MADEIPPPDDPMAQAEELLPWLKALPEDERREVFIDVIASVKNSLELGSTGNDAIGRIVTELASWKATAEVHADPELYSALTRPVRPEEFVEVARPMKPVGEPQAKPRRRCGASLPHEDAEDGWYWCDRAAGHSGLHNEGPDPAIAWEDGEIVEVYTTEEVKAVPHHIHDFVGDEDTCVRDPRCQLTWGGFQSWKSTWKGPSADLVIVDEIQDFPKQREGDDG